MKNYYRIATQLLVLGLIFIPFGCALLGKSANISITNPSAIPDLCVSINSSDKKEAKSVPYSHTAQEGDKVSITAFTSSQEIATGYVITRITNDCEAAVNYSAKIYHGTIIIDDDYVAVSPCVEKNSKTDD